MNHDLDPRPQGHGRPFSAGWCNVSDCYAHADSPARMAAPCPLVQDEGEAIEPIADVAVRYTARRAEARIGYSSDRAMLVAVRDALDAWDAGDIVSAQECAEVVRAIVSRAPSAIAGNSADEGQS